MKQDTSTTMFKGASLAPQVVLFVGLMNSVRNAKIRMLGTFLKVRCTIVMMSVLVRNTMIRTNKITKVQILKAVLVVLVYKTSFMKMTSV